MDVKSNRWIILLMLLGSLGILTVGISGYLLISGAPEEFLQEPVFAAQRILFISIVVFLGFLTVWVITIVRGISVEKRLDRLISKSRYRRLDRDADFAGFGSLGPRLRELYKVLTETNSKLRRKIASQGTLLDIIITNSPALMLVTDSSGTIVFASRVLLESLEKEKPNIINYPLSSVWEELSFSELRISMEETFSPISLKVEEYPLTAYPVVGSDGLISYVVFNAEKRPFMYNQKAQETRQKEVSLQSRLMGILRQSKRGEK